MTTKVTYFFPSHSFFNRTLNDADLPPALTRRISENALHRWNQVQGYPFEERFIFLMVGNGALVDMILSWLCNTERMKGVHQRTLILMTDTAGYRGLVRTPFDVHVVDSSLNDESLQSDMSYGTAAYWRMTERRVKMLGVILRSGVSFFNIEPDAVWVRNPLRDPRVVRSDHDMVVAVEMTESMEYQYAFGFLLLRSNARTRSLYDELERHLSASISSVTRNFSGPEEMPFTAELSEQMVLKKIISREMHSVSLSFLDACLYVSGRWYKNQEFRKYCKDTRDVPYVINNNWIVGNKAKIERAKLWGHWFIDDNGRCDRHESRRFKTAIVED